MGSNLYPELVRLGSHEIWYSPISERRFGVPRNTVIVHTANAVLKDAGLPKAF